SLTGDASDDTFVFGVVGTTGQKVAGKIDGGGGLNTLDYHLYKSAVVTNLQTSATTGATQGFQAGTVQKVIGGSSAADSLVGKNAPNTWTITGNEAGDVNGFQFQEIEKVTGGTSTDSFTVNTTAAVTM